MLLIRSGLPVWLSLKMLRLPPFLTNFSFSFNSQSKIIQRRTQLASEIGLRKQPMYSYPYNSFRASQQEKMARFSIGFEPVSLILILSSILYHRSLFFGENNQ